MRVVRFAKTAEIVQRELIEVGASSGPELEAPDWMTAAEARRFRRLRRAEDRAAYAAAHLLVRICAGELLSADPYDLTLVQSCRGCGRADHGPPRILGSRVHVSLSHCRGRVAAIASRHPCGIDVESVGGAIPRHALSPAEARWLALQKDSEVAFTRLWVRKEALVKAGRGSLARAADVDALTPDADVSEWGGEDARGAWCEVR